MIEPSARDLYFRVYHLPTQLQRAREKVARLEAEARELGMHDLLHPGRQA